ncbi:MAG: putative ubiquitin-conjugating enzyme E2 D/E, partial [Streblomastix strix]
DDKNFLKDWQITFDGPKGTPYEGGKFHLVAKPPTDFPFKPPHFSFTHKVYHCNVLPDGSHICNDKLAEATWKPATRMGDAINIILELFKNPEPDSALLPEIGVEFTVNRAEYNRKAKEYTQNFAK